MADFRKWFLAFAVLALLSSLASAQTVPSFQCQTNAGVPPILRAEGLTEMVGDVTLNCTGGVPTPVTQTVPQANIRIFLSTNVTSRLLGVSNFNEAELIADEPHSSSNPTVPLLMCGDAGTTETFTNSGVCIVTGSTGTINGVANVPGVGTYNGTTQRPNAFLGRSVSGQANAVDFNGVPFDPPGTNFTRVFRITNVRGNANQLGVSSTLVPTQVTMYITISSSTSILVNNPQQTVGVVQPGLVSSVSKQYSFRQCNNANGNQAKDNTSGSLGSGGQDGSQFYVTFQEGFPSSWKPKNLAQFNANGTLVTSNPSSGLAWKYTTGSAAYGSGDFNQNVPGVIYNTESGFLNASGNTVPPQVPAGAVESYFTRAAVAGRADQGTRLMMQFASVPNGSQIFVPTIMPIVSVVTPTQITGVAVLTATDANGAGAFAAVTKTNSINGLIPNKVGSLGGMYPISIVNQGGMAVYEVLFDDPTATERLDIPVFVAYVANLSNNLPQPGLRATAALSFAPVSNVGVADTSAPIPRFAPGLGPLNTFIINKCSCNILFPYVANVLGFDTGVAISNTSADIYGTGPQAGLVTINYFQNPGTAPAAQTTNAVVPAGGTLAFTLNGGGNYGIDNRGAGFVGYIIAQAQFQYCHGFAYLSAFGQPYSGEGYLGLILDDNSLSPRSGQAGENIAH